MVAPKGHLPINGSCLHTPTIDRSMIDGWTFQSLISEQHAHFDDRRLMIGHSNHQSL